MRVVSVPGRRIVDPISRRVVDEVGIDVSEFDPLWNRLVDDGDVAVSPAPAAAKTSSSKE
jgi:hypothetical protein